jgi:hypothetical protein
MICPHCQYENSEGAKFCEECGTTLVRACPSCGHEVRPTAKFCPACGTPLIGRQGSKGAKGQKAKRKTTPDSKPQTLDSRL